MLNFKSRRVLFGAMLVVVVAATARPRSNFYEWDSVTVPPTECYGSSDVAVVCFLAGTGIVYSVEERR